MTEQQMRWRILEETYKARGSGNLPLQTTHYCSILGINPDDGAGMLSLGNALEYLVSDGYLRAERYRRHAAATLYIVKELLPKGIKVVEEELARRELAARTAAEAKHVPSTNLPLLKAVEEINQAAHSEAREAKPQAQPLPGSGYVPIIKTIPRDWWWKAGLPLAGLAVAAIVAPPESRTACVFVVLLIVLFSLGAFALEWIDTHEKATGKRFIKIARGLQIFRVSGIAVVVVLWISLAHPWSQQLPSAPTTPVPRRMLPVITGSTSFSGIVGTTVSHHKQSVVQSPSPAHSATPSVRIVYVTAKPLTVSSAARSTYPRPTALATPTLFPATLGPPSIVVSPNPTVSGQPDSVHFSVTYQMNDPSKAALHVSECAISEVHPASDDEATVTDALRARFAVARTACEKIATVREIQYLPTGAYYVIEHDMAKSTYDNLSAGKVVLYYVGIVWARGDDGKPHEFPVCGVVRNGSSVFMCAETHAVGH